MKVLMISGSPRKQGNTVQILKELAAALYDTDVSLVSLAELKLNGCLGCSVCQKNLIEPGCVQNDDIAYLLQKVMAADAIVYGTPLYGHSCSGQLKLLMDRHVALFKFVDGSDKAVEEMEILSFIQNKPVALVVSCQGPKEQNTELVTMQFEKFCESSLAHNLGTYVFPWCDPEVTGSQYDSAVLQAMAAQIHGVSAGR